MKYRVLKLGAIACFIALLAGCVKGDEVSGVVTDQATAKPVEGVFVQVQWLGRSAGLVDSEGERCLSTAVGQTDSQGAFHVGPWKRIRRPLEYLLSQSTIRAELRLYKPGYLIEEPRIAYKDGRYSIKMFKGTPAERAKNLGQSFYSCNGLDRSDKYAIPYLRVMLQEARQIPPSDRATVFAKDVVDEIRTEICSDSLAYGQFDHDYWDKVQECAKQL